MAFAVASGDAEQSLIADPLPVCSEESVLLCHSIHGDLHSRRRRLGNAGRYGSNGVYSATICNKHECAFSAGHTADGAAAAGAGGVRAVDLKSLNAIQRTSLRQCLNLSCRARC